LFARSARAGLPEGDAVDVDDEVAVGLPVQDAVRLHAVVCWEGGGPDGGGGAVAGNRF